MEGEQPNPQGSLAIESNSRVHEPTEPEKPQLQGTDFGDRNSWNKVTAMVYELEMYDGREQALQILGLPQETTWDEVKNYIYEQEDVYVARAYGLPKDTPSDVINEIFGKEEEEHRKDRAREFGLPEDAGSDVIDRARTAVQAKSLGLPETARHSEVWVTQKERKRKLVFEALGISDKNVDWETILQKALCISGLGSGGVPTAEDYLKRIQEVRKWRIDQVTKEAPQIRIPKD